MSENKKNGKNHNTSKEQLEKELLEMKENMREQGIELKKAKAEIGVLESKMLDQEELQNKLKTLEEDLEAITQEADQNSKKMKLLIDENNELKRMREELSLQNKKLKGEMEQIKTDSTENQRTIMQLREVEKQNIKLENKIKQLEKTISQLDIKYENEAEIGMSEPALIDTPSTSFRIDLYKRQGNYQGIIHHYLTKQKATFTGIDQEKIFQFISQHLSKPVKALQTEQEPHKPHEKTTVPIEMEFPDKIVFHNEPFKIKMKLDMTEIPVKRYAPITCDVSILARSLLGGDRRTIVSTQDTVQTNEVVRLETVSSGLAEGMYRLESFITFRLPDGKPAPFNTFSKSGLVYVH